MKEPSGKWGGGKKSMTEYLNLSLICAFICESRRYLPAERILNDKSKDNGGRNFEKKDK